MQENEEKQIYSNMTKSSTPVIRTRRPYTLTFYDKARQNILFYLNKETKEVCVMNNSVGAEKRKQFIGDKEIQRFEWLLHPDLPGTLVYTICDYDVLANLF